MAATKGPTMVDVSEIGSLGGKARAKKMTAEERKESARNAVNARWAKVKKIETEPPASSAVKPVKKLGKKKAV